jgi:hypothetical protein
MLSCQQDFRYTKERNDLRGNTSGTEFSVAETAGQLGEGVTGSGEEVEEEGGGDISAGRVLDLLEGGSEAVLIGADCQSISVVWNLCCPTHVWFLEQAAVITSG